MNATVSNTVLTVGTVLALVVGAGTSLRAGAPRFDPNWLPDMGTVAKLEAQINMPSGTRPLNAYVRFYTGYQNAPGQRTIHGVLLAHEINDSLGPDWEGTRPVNIVPFRRFPLINDGGCSNLHVEYDMRANAVIEQPWCDPLNPFR
jgi:hypothetical protein